MIDIEALLQPLSEESPCGTSLEYDPAYLELERVAQGTPEQQVGENTVIQAEEPDWRDLRERCRDLLGRTKDLRVLMYQALALLRTEGLPGLRDGLGAIRGVLEQYWDQVHPQLDPDDDFDPLERLNVISALAPDPRSDASQDPMKFRQRLLETPLTESRQAGRFSYRDLLVARGELNPPVDDAESRPDVALIDAAFADTEIEHLQGLAAALSESVEHVNGIDAVLAQRVGPSQAPNLDAFVAALEEVGRCVHGYLAERGVSAGAAPGAMVEVSPDGAGGAPLTGDIRSTQDVLAAIDKICRYFEREEPSSPVPLLLRRAQRLVSKSFVEIIQDLSPDAMRQIEIISGSEGES